jgi:3-hydroxyacyl-CoA dehydrogenase
LRQTGDARWEPVPMLRELVSNGRLGNKTGGGFLTQSG